MEVIATESIDPNEIYGKVKKENAGSVVMHYAVVREKTGEQITKTVEFQRDGDIENELKSITDDMRQMWQLEDVFIARRLGTLQVGEVISVVATSAPHREDAFDACRYGIERLKTMRTVKKTEQ